MNGPIFFILDVGRGCRWVLSCLSQPGQQRWPLICVMAGSIFWGCSLLFTALQDLATTSKFEGHLGCHATKVDSVAIQGMGASCEAAA